jgi:hypothetical protein
MKALLIALLFAVPALAAEEPEAVYAKFHNAAVQANLSEMSKWGTAAGAAEIAAMPAAMQQQMLKFLASVLPRTYTVDDKRLEGDRATLKVSAQQQQGTIRGIVALVKEGGEWKVEHAKWGEP